MILHVYSGNLFGGIESNLVALFSADRARPDGSAPRHAVALCFEGQLAGELRSLGANPQILGPVRFRYPWTTWLARRRLARLLGNPVLKGVVAHGSWAYRLAEPAARQTRVPIALWNHDPFRGLGPLETYALAHPPDFLVANSRFTARALEEAFGRPADRVVFPASRHASTEIPPGTRFRIRAEFETLDDAVVILLFSRFEPLKGHAVLLEALAKLRDDPKWHCWLVGGVQKPAEIAYRDSLRQFSKSAGIESRVRFAGHRDDIPAILAAADIHCQPNIEPDSFGLTYVEALAAGLPSVGSDLGGVPEILTPGCGRLVPPGDAQSLAETLSALIANAPLRQRLGQQGRERAKSLRDVQAGLRSLESLFDQGRGEGAAR